MIITQTPFRIPLGGGGTDLPGFYQKHGGYLLSATINKYMYITLNRPVLDRLIRLKYSESETVESPGALTHELAREALRFCGITDQIEITSFADIGEGTGMGSSGSYIVGLLKALHALKREAVGLQDLAEEACHIEIDILQKPVGKQDQYLAAFGGFVEMDIAPNGSVRVATIPISQDALEELHYKTVLFYTHQKHTTVDILQSQNQQAAVPESQVEKSLLRIKEIGRELAGEFKRGQVAHFGKFMDEHWQVKKQMSHKISDPRLDGLYELAKANGAEGGKIMGSGGGGLFMFFVPRERNKLKKALAEEGLTEMPYNFSSGGSKVLLDLYT